MLYFVKLLCLLLIIVIMLIFIYYYCLVFSFYVMTSKELFRRLEFYSLLDFASQCFDSELVDFIYHVSFCHKGLKSERFVLSYSYFYNYSPVDLDSFDFLYFEKFTRSEFNSQVRYFISFYSRCSVRQREILRSSGKLSSLLQYVVK